jgi:hypothetical protein
MIPLPAPTSDRVCRTPFCLHTHQRGAQSHTCRQPPVSRMVSSAPHAPLGLEATVWLTTAAPVIRSAQVQSCRAQHGYVAISRPHYYHLNAGHGEDVLRYTPPNPSSRRLHDDCAARMYISFEVSCKTTMTVRKHSSREHTAMNNFKRLWQWYSDRRIERRLLKGHGVYRSQTNQAHIPGRKMPTLPISTTS